VSVTLAAALLLVFAVLEAILFLVVPTLTVMVMVHHAKLAVL
jgi:hypothetical protein